MSVNQLLDKQNSQVHRQVVKANQAYVKSFGSKTDLALPPARKFAILTCMDARIDPAKLAGLSEGDLQAGPGCEKP